MLHIDGTIEEKGVRHWLAHKHLVSTHYVLEQLP
jgi:hypothetical protein